MLPLLPWLPARVRLKTELKSTLMLSVAVILMSPPWPVPAVLENTSASSVTLTDSAEDIHIASRTLSLGFHQIFD